MVSNDVVDEFLTTYRSEGFASAVKWMARVSILLAFQRSVGWVPAILSPVIIDRDELPSRADAAYWYGDSEDVTITMPDGIEDPDEMFVSRLGEFSISRPYVCVVENATLVGEYPIPLTADKKVILEALVSPAILTLNVGYTLYHRLQNGRLRSREKRHVDTAVLLHHSWNNGYFHWTCETLTRLEGVQRYVDETGDRPKLIVGPELTPYQEQSLSLLGYDEDDLIRWEGQKATVGRLIVPSARRELNDGETSPVAYEWLRDRMLESVSQSEAERDDDFSPYLYVSRDDAPRRRVVNEDRVVDVLSRYGFQRRVLSEQSVEENVRMFSQAEVIVGPHGAGLADIIYSTDATLIELFRSNDLRPVYFVLSRQLGHDYRYVSCDYEGPNLRLSDSQLAELEDRVREAVERKRGAAAVTDPASRQ